MGKKDENKDLATKFKDLERDNDELKKVIEVAREREVPVRIGVNSGSIEKDLLAK